MVTSSTINQDLRSKDTGRESRLWARWLPTMLSRLPARQEGKVPTTSLEDEAKYKDVALFANKEQPTDVRLRSVR